MNEDDKRRADILLSLSQQAWQSMDGRRSYEWKLSLALWSALAAFAAVILQEQEPLSNPIPTRSQMFCLAIYAAFGIAIVGAHYSWCRWALTRQHLDRDIAIHFEKKLRILLGIEDDFIKELGERCAKCTSHRWGSMNIQVVITFMLVISVGLLFAWKLGVLG